MITLRLQAGEVEVLVDALERHLSDLRMEIANTDQKDYRDVLKQRKTVLNGVLEQLSRASLQATVPSSGE